MSAEIVETAHFFNPFFKLGAQISPKSPQNHSRPLFSLIFDVFGIDFKPFLDNVEAEERRKETEKGQHSVLFFVQTW